MLCIYIIYDRQFLKTKTTGAKAWASDCGAAGEGDAKGRGERAEDGRAPQEDSQGGRGTRGRLLVLSGGCNTDRYEVLMQRGGGGMERTHLYNTCVLHPA